MKKRAKKPYKCSIEQYGVIHTYLKTPGFAQFADAERLMKNQLRVQIAKQMDVLMQAGRELVSVFKERISSYNLGVDSNRRCYLKPVIRYTKQDPLNPLLEFKWVRSYNENYLKATGRKDIRPKKGEKYGTKDLPKDKNGFTPLKSFNKFLTPYEQSCLNIILETEQAMRNLQQEYKRLIAIRLILDTWRPNQVMTAIAINQRNEQEGRLPSDEASSTIERFFEGKLQVDPFNLPKKQSLVTTEGVSGGNAAKIVAAPVVEPVDDDLDDNVPL